MLPATQLLPITKYKRQILYCVEQNDVTLISAETGSGKTTQIPQYLLQAGYALNGDKIAVAVPRRIAAISISKRIGDEMGLHNGEIAYHVRFDSNANHSTKVCFMTDGMMVQKLYQDPLLTEFKVLVLDDIHERSISFDILFGMLKKILQKRTDLKVIILSATMEEQRLKAYFQKDKSVLGRQLKVDSLSIMGRLHSVQIHYLREPSRNYFLKTFQTIIYIERQTQRGNVLVFLTSVQEIEGMVNMLDSYQYENKRKLCVLPLHSALSAEKQSKIFESSYDRKIILSTNIAESSITIPDIEFVVDSGYVKCKVYDIESGVEKMMVVPCGQYSCKQRCGRAGRVQNGVCYRIFTEQAYNTMPQRLVPEIMRIDLSAFILKLKGLGIFNVSSFEFFESPPEYNTIKAINTLFAYGLVDKDFELTEKGQRVGELPLSLRNSCMLMNSFDDQFGCSEEILMLVSMLEVQRELFVSHGLSVIKTKKRVGTKQGDFLSLINIFLRFYKAKNYEKKRVCSEMKVRPQAMEHSIKIHAELVQQIKSFNRFKSEQEKMAHMYSEQASSEASSKKKMYFMKSSSDVHETILRCIFSGYFTNIAQLQGDGSYINIRSKEKLQLHPSSILSVTLPEWIVYLEIIKSHNYYIYNGSQIEADWIFELAGHYYQDTRRTHIESSFQKEKEIEKPDYTLQHQAIKQQSTKGIVQIGGSVSNNGEKKQVEYFKTEVLGLKKKNLRKNKLSFGEDDI